MVRFLEQNTCWNQENSTTVSFLVVLHGMFFDSLPLMIGSFMVPPSQSQNSYAYMLYPSMKQKMARMSCFQAVTEETFFFTVTWMNSYILLYSMHMVLYLRCSPSLTDNFMWSVIQCESQCRCIFSTFCDSSSLSQRIKKNFSYPVKQLGWLDSNGWNLISYL